MRLRRKRILSALRTPDEIAVTVPAFPLAGVGERFTAPPHAPGGPTADSALVPDALITAIPRFHSLTRRVPAKRPQR